ncbi:hypothetical protein bgla_1g14650 [Burkholderia gladioli BSR3]|uniref:Uncharacterized protein n=1 Tax=Burkholderia gladioli (strain BSR3) TaxID=999541 RepID=F2LB66_BURGS|nr:hypothetical protein bgla_1g14650 [Burkholderia gladioli BSR3]
MLDASVLFNLLGSGVPKDFIRALDVPCLVEERTAAEIRRMPGERAETAPLRALIDDGLLQLCRMPETAYITYLSLVTGTSADTLDDGESAAIAMASDGAGGVVLDDKKARRILRERFPSLGYGSSLALMVMAAQRAGWELERLQDALTKARSTSRMAVVPDERPIFDRLFAPVSM